MSNQEFKMQDLSPSYYVDFSDMSALFQDEACTVPVTEFGQTVRSVRSPSGVTVLLGNAVLHRDENGRNYLTSAE